MDIRNIIQQKEQLRKGNILGGFSDAPKETELEKGKKAAIGEIRMHGGKKVKKIAEGKWQEVSVHGMTKKEHQSKLDEINSSQGKSDYDTRDKEGTENKEYSKHYKAHKELSDKEYTDEEVHGQVDKDKNTKLIESMSNEMLDHWISNVGKNQKTEGDRKLFEQLGAEKAKRKYKEYNDSQQKVEDVKSSKVSNEQHRLLSEKDLEFIENTSVALQDYEVTEIKEALNSINSYFKEYLERDVQLPVNTLEKLLVQNDFILDELVTMLCELEDTNKIEKILKGEVDEFSYDPWSDSDPWS